MKVEKLGGIIKVFVDEFIFEFSRFRYEGNMLKAFVTIKKIDSDEMLFYQHINLESPKSKDDFAEEVNNKLFLDDKISIQKLVFNVCDAVVKSYYEKEGFEVLEQDEFEEYSPPQFLVSPFVYKNTINLFYGKGGTFKTFFVLYLLKHINSNVLWLNYEMSREEIKRRMYMIGINKLHHRNCKIPLTEEVEIIIKYIKENKIDVVVIDSIGVALSNLPLTDIQSATTLVNILNQFETTSILIGHQPKDNNLPFGSSYFYNLPKNIWQTNVIRTTDENFLILKHIKNNLGKQLKPKGFKVAFDENLKTVDFIPISIYKIPNYEEFVTEEKIDLK